MLQGMGNQGLEGLEPRMRAGGRSLAGALLGHRDIMPDTAARLVLEALEESDACRLEGEAEINRVRHIIRLGVECYRQLRNTIPFGELVERTLHRKCYRRERTLQEILQYARRLMRCNPDLGSRPVRLITAPECRRMIENTFVSPTMRHKARTLMHGLFGFAMRQGWCSCNPLDQVEFPPNPERRISAMDIASVHNLLAAALTTRHLPCAAGLGILLWAGVRPNELERLQWRNVNLKDRIITIPPEHAKTGGARQVTIQPILKAWLIKVTPYRLPDCYIAPASWCKRWRNLRRDAGISKWDADILRHTFASYHLKRFRNLQDLQVDMGHASTDLLRTRYLNMEGVTAAAAKDFWSMDLDAIKPHITTPPDPPSEG